jgi:hypothetical protein
VSGDQRLISPKVTGCGNGGPQCDFGPSDNGSHVGLNPAFISLGDQAVQNLVEAN